MISVRFFARLREQLGCEQLDWPACADLYTLRSALIEAHPDWEKALSGANLLVAVNQELVQGNIALTGDEEVAFFPPVTGG